MDTSTTIDGGTARGRAESRSSASYVHALRDRPQLWRTVAAVAAGLAALLVVVLVAVVPIGIALDRLLGVTPFDPAVPTLTAGFWLAGNLLLALLIPVSGLLQWAIYRERSRWLSSVAGRFRWRVLARAAVFVVPLSVVYAIAVQVVMPSGAIDPTATTIALAVAALITVPLQSAGEEYLFRGLLFRAIGARFHRAAVATAVATASTALLFSAIHGSTDGWAFAYYALAGVCFAVMTQTTGGVEVAVLVHATNNTLLLIPIILAGGLGTVSVTTGPVLLLPMAVMVLVTVLVRTLAPRLTGRGQGQRAEGRS